MSVEEKRDVLSELNSRCAGGAPDRRMHDRERQLWWVLVVVWILTAGSAEAQQTSTATPDEAAIVSARVPPPASAQIGGMLGGAEYMLILDRPFAAEKLFNAVLALDPKNEHALDGLRRVKLAKRTSWTFLGHAFGNGYKTQLVTWGGGPSFYTSLGKVTFWVGDGFFGAPAPSSGTWTSLQKITLNGFWEPYYKNFDGYAYINRTLYPQAPDRTLYDFKGTWNRHPGREYYAVFGGQHDSFLQDDTAQFFAPESITEVKEKILIRNIGATAQIPLGKYIDFIPTFSQFYYTGCQENCAALGNTPSNSRQIAQGKLMYRVLPRGGAQMPIFRIGAEYLWDKCDFGSGIYNCPVNFHSVSVTADFIFVTGKYRYGVFAYYPITGTSGEGQFPNMGRFDPTEALYSFLNYKVTESQELWVKFLGAHSAGFSPKAFDVVVGTTLRF
jgi:hypothetical protein